MSTRSQFVFWAIFIPLLILPSLSLKAPGFVHGETKPEKPLELVEVVKVWVTAYSSSPDETDSTPLITAVGTDVRDGVIAANFLPFGTLVKVPKLFGDKVFVVEDRMNSRKNWIIDIWMPSKGKAIEFGSHFTEVQVVKRPTASL